MKEDPPLPSEFVTQQHMQFYHKYGFIVIKGVYPKGLISETLEGHGRPSVMKWNPPRRRRDNPTTPTTKQKQSAKNSEWQTMSSTDPMLHSAAEWWKNSNSTNSNSHPDSLMKSKPLSPTPLMPCLKTCPNGAKSLLKTLIDSEFVWPLKR